MPFINKEDLSTHIYPEGMDAISREDDSNIEEAITAAIQESSQYLSKYDTEAIFSTEGEDKKKYSNLITYIKDIAKWHFIAVANVTVDLELAERRYSAAIKGLIQISRTVMKGWPLMSDDYIKPFRSGSNSKFNHSGF
ncbi:DUF1320 domain-containing protein [Cecembia rubra]|uniref:Uncharacterized protein n=1 Tax=Cecembia rubra TaxID=1485585 RepID=A0A2P8EAQ5_9BACT|nr:DUF1320 domain-containing protein [Cecembia rubra]PSL06549.1 hypothetical protein CLV48_102366 [Cecembia rubra]